MQNLAKHYILVHGAWHGAWAWRYVAPRLESLGHEVTAIDLPGHGNNKQNFQNINLNKYVEHTAELVEKSKLPVVLVGHSMAGVVVSQVAEHHPEKINTLVYVSAFVPSYNGSLVEEEKQAKIPSVALEISINEPELSISVNPHRIKDLFYGCCNNEDLVFAASNLQKQPLMPFIDKVALSESRFGCVPKLYIECLRDRAIRVEDQRRMYSKIKCDVASIDTDHSPFFSSVDQLVEHITR